MHAEEDEVIQLARDLDPAHESVFLCKTFCSLEQLLIFIAFGSTKGCKPKERARVVLLTLTRGGGNEVNQPIITRDFEHVAEGRHQHVARGGREIRALACELLNEELPIARRQVSHVARSKVTDQAPVIIVEEQPARADVVLIALACLSELLSLLDEAVSIGAKAELRVGGSITTRDLLSIFFSDLARFNAIGLLGGANLVALRLGSRMRAK